MCSFSTKDNWLDSSESNCNALENIINSIRCNKFIHLSSCSIFSELSKLTGNPEPQDFYGLAKLVSEKILKLYLKKINSIIILRFPIVLSQ